MKCFHCIFSTKQKPVGNPPSRFPTLLTWYGPVNQISLAFLTYRPMVKAVRMYLAFQRETLLGNRWSTSRWTVEIGTSRLHWSIRTEFLVLLFHSPTACFLLYAEAWVSLKDVVVVSVSTYPIARVLFSSGANWTTAQSRVGWYV